MHGTENIQGLHRRLNDYGSNKYSAKKKQLREDLSIGEKVFILAERMKKKSAPEQFYKQSVQNIGYFNKGKIFIIRAIQTINKIKYYWLKNAETNRKASKRFMRTELFTLKSNFFQLKTCIQHIFIKFNKFLALKP